MKSRISQSTSANGKERLVIDEPPVVAFDLHMERHLQESLGDISGRGQFLELFKTKEPEQSERARKCRERFSPFCIYFQCPCDPLNSHLLKSLKSHLEIPSHISHFQVRIGPLQGIEN